MTSAQTMSCVMEAVRAVATQRTSLRAPITADTSLTDDLGFDSLAFVDLGLELDRKFGSGTISIHDWFDAECRLAGRASCTVRSLAEHVARARAENDP